MDLKKDEKSFKPGILGTGQSRREAFPAACGSSPIDYFIHCSLLF
ncbi:hypothetical protein [Aedoeadaptatus pacaensis]|nr:hypothetical protein [Peptoniphilus pacaensis]